MKLILDINNFGPFRAEVWGSVTDWLVFIVTAITAWYLYKTLQSQVEVQKLGQEALKYERIRITQEVQPYFNVENLAVKIETRDSKKRLKTNFRLKNIGGGEAINWDFIVDNSLHETIEEPWIIDSENFHKQNYIVPGDHVIVHSHGPLFSVSDFLPSRNYESTLNFFLRFEDVFENKYLQQGFIIFYSEGDHDILCYPPMIQE